jgi:hypothetical protein
MAGKGSSSGPSSTRPQLPRAAKGNGVRKADSSSGSSNQRPVRRPVRAKSKVEAAKSEADTATTRVTKAITFGIEFEFVLAFQEETLYFMREMGAIIDILKEYDHSKQKSLLKCEEKQNNGAYLGGQRLWPSWLLRVPDDDEAIANDAVRGTSMEEPDTNRVRRYSMEPLLVAKQALSNAGLNTVQVIGWMDKRQLRAHCQECEDPSRVMPIDHYNTSFGQYGNDVLLRGMDPKYDRWTLTNDYTIVPVRRSVLRDRLAARGIMDPSVWDSYGLELITRIMKFQELEASFEEIKQHFTALRAQEHVDALESVWSTAHVHIGFNREAKADLSFRFFQHVAFMLLCYENLITLCFPRRSSGIAVPMSDDHPAAAEEATQPAFTQAAARDANDAVVKRLEENYTGADDVRSNHNYMCEWLASDLGKSADEITWQNLRDEIFADNDNLVHLMQYMQEPVENTNYEGQRSRSYMVNWCNIYTIWAGETNFKNFKPTLEFRQHPCTIDADEIKHWVLLLQAVMKVAGDMVVTDTRYGTNEPLDQSRTYAEREGSKYPHAGLPFGTVKAYVTQLLGLDETEGLYWENRFEKFKDDRPM